MLLGDQGLPEEPTQEQRWAILKLREFRYRQLFGLSKDEMMDEPYDDFVVNEKIDALLAEKERREAERHKVQQKMRYG